MSNNTKWLLVDDDANDRARFIETLRLIDSSINCIIAEDCYKALLLLKDEQEDLPEYIFLEIRMPAMNGNKCLSEIKKDPRLKSIPVIIYTRSSNIIDSFESYEAGALHFITKPSDPQEIYYLLSTVINEKWG